jgi:hypothetical protein
MTPEDFVARQLVRGAADRIAACGVEDDQLGNFQIVAEPRIGFVGDRIGETAEDTLSERLD